MIEINVPEVNVDEIMERIREEIRRRKPDYCGAALPASECSNRGEIPQPSKPCFPHLESLPGPTPFVVKEGGYHINDFLQYHDQDFVRNAYRGILCREADPAGYNYYLEALRQGTMTKVELLGRLRYAKEGRSKTVKVRGLLTPFVAHTSYRIPLLGYLCRLLTGLLQLPTIIRNLQLLDLHTQKQFFELRDHVNRHGDIVHSKLDEIMGHQSALEGLCNAKADRSELQTSIEDLLSLRLEHAQLQSR